MVKGLLGQFVVSGTNPIYSPYMALGAKLTQFISPPNDNVLPATIAVLTHAAVAIGYILYTVHHRVVGAGSISGAWCGMGEMLALASHSGRARELQNVGGGVEARSTWKMKVRVQEWGGHRLELVAGTKDLDGARPQLDKKYR